MLRFKKIRKIISEEKRQFKAFIILSVFALILSIITFLVDRSVFLRFIGDNNPILVVFLSILMGFTLLTFLISRVNLKIYEKQESRNYWIIAGIAVLFGIEVIAADIWLVDYAADINVLFPLSLLFYPAIGFIAEVFFHLLPLSIFIMIFSFIKRLSINTTVWISIFLVSAMEPVYQIIFTSDSSSITSIYTGIHVFLFSLAQLIIFKRMDFISMYIFRIIFYLIWHISWGYFRLNLIF